MRRGSDVTSDHHLLTLRIKLKLKKSRTETTRRQRYNVGLLRETGVREESKLVLSNRFQALQDLVDEEEATTTEQHWKAVREMLNSTCKDTVGFRKHHHKDWLSAQTLKKIDVRKQKKAVVNNSRTRAAKARAQEEYSEANREVKRSIRADKRAYIDSLAADAEKAAGSSNMKQLYDITRRLLGKYGHTDRPVKDKEGKRQSRPNQ